MRAFILPAALFLLSLASVLSREALFLSMPLLLFAAITSYLGLVKEKRQRFFFMLSAGFLFFTVGLQSPHLPFKEWVLGFSSLWLIVLILKHYLNKRRRVRH